MNIHNDVCTAPDDVVAALAHFEGLRDATIMMYGEIAFGAFANLKMNRSVWRAHMQTIDVFDETLHGGLNKAMVLAVSPLIKLSCAHGVVARQLIAVLGGAIYAADLAREALKSYPNIIDDDTSCEEVNP